MSLVMIVLCQAHPRFRFHKDLMDLLKLSREWHFVVVILGFFSFLLLVSVSFCIVTCVVNSCCVFQNLLINFCIKSCSCRIFIALFCVAMAVTNFMQSVSSNLSQIELSNSV